MRKRIILAVFILLLFSFNASASDTLSLAKWHDNLGWQFKWQKHDIRNSNFCFRQAIQYYTQFINEKEITIADLESRRFTPFDAQKRIVYIYKFGLLDQARAKQELQKLSNMYKKLYLKYRSSKVLNRVRAKINQLNSEFKYNGYIVHVDKDSDRFLCLFLSKVDSSEIIVYQDLIPIARAKIKGIKLIDNRKAIVSAQVSRSNPLKKIELFCNAGAAVANKVEADEKKSSLAHKYYQTGIELFEKREFEEAQENFWEAVKYAPDNKEALNMLGLVYFYFQDMENAKKLYISALEIDPAYLEAYIDLAGAYLASSDFPVDTNNVLDMLEGSLKVSQNYIRVYYWLGHFWDDFMFFERAKQYYKLAATKLAVLTVDNWYKQTSLKKKLSSTGQIYWDTANIYLEDKEPILNSGIYVFEEMLKFNSIDAAVKERISGIVEVCPFVKDSSLYGEVIAHRKQGLALEGGNRLKEAIDEMRTSLYLDQIVSSEFRRCIRKIPRVKID